jgi:hypothetical protein
VASPDDVERERRRVERVVERLNGEFAGVVRIEAICSQAAFQFHGGDVDFEDVPTPADCDSGPSTGHGNIERECPLCDFGLHGIAYRGIWNICPLRITPP